MIVVDAHPAPAPARAATGRVWGLGAEQLLEAYWAARGVHCVRRGEAQVLPSGADLFLLLEPGQLAQFDLDQLVEHILWRKAAVTRVRIIDEDRDFYRERVIVDDDGLVRSVERQYRAQGRSVCRVMLTARRRIAMQWMTAESPRAGWVDIRRRLRVEAIDYLSCPGLCSDGREPEDRGRFLDRLVQTWAAPDQSIDGIEEIADGVWAPRGVRPGPDQLLIGPAWIGHGALPGGDACWIGPAWAPDEVDAEPAEIRTLAEIEWTSRADGEPAGDDDGRPGYAIAKRAFDVVCSALVLTLGLPLFAVVALSIMIEDGRPVFYAQMRQTRGGRLFRCWKFRSMRHQAESMVGDLVAANICDGPQVAIRNDPRVTRVGRIIRRLQIDELPQFWNVLRGEMSIVGPRPSPERENQYCPAWRELRLSVRPGITGLWQLKRTRKPGRDFQEWIRYDIEYVTRAGFLFDLGICIRTAWVLLTGRRA